MNSSSARAASQLGELPACDHRPEHSPVDCIDATGEDCGPGQLARTADRGNRRGLRTGATGEDCGPGQLANASPPPLKGIYHGPSGGDTKVMAKFTCLAGAGTKVNSQDQNPNSASPRTGAAFPATLNSTRGDQSSARILAKLELRDRVDAVIVAHQTGLLP
jgi:hypothetical protein